MKKNEEKEELTQEDIRSDMASWMACSASDINEICPMKITIVLSN